MWHPLPVDYRLEQKKIYRGADSISYFIKAFRDTNTSN